MGSRKGGSGCARLAEHAVGEVDQRAFQVAEGDMFADRQAFHLVELRFVAGVGLFVAVHMPGTITRTGSGAYFLHEADLPG